MIKTMNEDNMISTMKHFPGYGDNVDTHTGIAIDAGNDIIISSNFKKQRDEVLNAVRQGKIPEELINTAVRRILACKYAYGII